MTGPGGPPGYQCAANADGSREQVLLARLPDCDPDVHLARLNVADCVLSLREARVDASGSVSLAREHKLPLRGSTIAASGELKIEVRQGNRHLAQLMFESSEDERAWAKAITDVIATAAQSASRESVASVAGAAVAAAGGEDVSALKARSAMLQKRIGSLEAISDRRDKQLTKLTSRLEGAMKMLGAVQDMCCQQKKVIDAQDVAISELRRDAGLASDGEGDDEEASNVPSALPGARVTTSSATCPAGAGALAPPDVAASTGPSAGAAAAMAAALAGAAAETAAEAVDTDMPAEAEEMLKLLQQADEMQEALRQLQAMSGGALGGQDGSPGRGAAGLLTGLSGMTPSQHPLVPPGSGGTEPPEAEQEQAAEEQAAVLLRNRFLS